MGIKWVASDSFIDAAVMPHAVIRGIKVKHLHTSVVIYSQHLCHVCYVVGEEV